MLSGEGRGLEEVVAQCELKAALGTSGVACEEERCTYWRFAEAVTDVPPGPGCAIQYFSLLEGGEEVAAWLLSVKERLEKQRGGGR